MRRSNPSSRRPLAWMLAISALALCGPPLVATQVRLVNLEQMTHRAAIIFSGRCVEVRTEHDAALRADVTVAEFQVDRAVKGELGPTVTLRMLSGGPAGMVTPGGVAGAPRFREGEQVILFVHGESSLGLTSPVGLGQGKFSVVDDGKGGVSAVNAFGNRGLLRGMPVAAAAALEPAGSHPGAVGVDPTALLDMAISLGP